MIAADASTEPPRRTPPTTRTRPIGYAPPRPGAVPHLDAAYAPSPCRPPRPALRRMTAAGPKHLLVVHDRPPTRRGHTPDHSNPTTVINTVLARAAPTPSPPPGHTWSTPTCPRSPQPDSSPPTIAPPRPSLTRHPRILSTDQCRTPPTAPASKTLIGGAIGAWLDGRTADDEAAAPGRTCSTTSPGPKPRRPSRPAGRPPDEWAPPPRSPTPSRRGQPPPGRTRPARRRHRRPRSSDHSRHRTPWGAGTTARNRPRPPAAATPSRPAR